MEEKGNFNENRLMQNYIVQKNEVIRSDSVKIKISFHILKCWIDIPRRQILKDFARIGICVATRHVICHYDVFVLFAFCCCFFFFFCFSFLDSFFSLVLFLSLCCCVFVSSTSCWDKEHFFKYLTFSMFVRYIVPSSINSTRLPFNATHQPVTFTSWGQMGFKRKLR